MQCSFTQSHNDCKWNSLHLSKEQEGTALCILVHKLWQLHTKISSKNHAKRITALHCILPVLVNPPVTTSRREVPALLQHFGTLNLQQPSLPHLAHIPGALSFPFWPTGALDAQLRPDTLKMVPIFHSLSASFSLPHSLCTRFSPPSLSHSMPVLLSLPSSAHAARSCCNARPGRPLTNESLWMRHSGSCCARLPTLHCNPHGLTHGRQMQRTVTNRCWRYMQCGCRCCCCTLARRWKAC